MPWHLNGTLAADESHLVAAHLAECPRCRTALGAEQALAESVRADDTSVPPAPHPRSASRLLARLDEGGATAVPVRARQSRVRETYRATPAAVRGLMLAQLAAIVLLLIGLPRLIGVPGPAAPQPASPAPAAPAAPTEYRTLADAEPGVGAARTLRVVFAATATEVEIRAVLAEIRGQIVAGPSPLGAYRVAVPSNGDPLTVVLAHLRNQSSVAFAEPVAGEPSPDAP